MDKKFLNNLFIDCVIFGCISIILEIFYYIVFNYELNFISGIFHLILVTIIFLAIKKIKRKKK